MNGGDSITEAIGRECEWRDVGRPIAGWMIVRLTGGRDDRRLMSGMSYRKGCKRFPRTASRWQAVSVCGGAMQLDCDAWLEGPAANHFPHGLSRAWLARAGAA